MTPTFRDFLKDSMMGRTFERVQELEKLFKKYDPDAWEEFLKVAKKKGYTKFEIDQFNKYMEAKRK